MGDDPDGPDGILEDSWLQRKAPGLIIIFYAKAIVSFDGVLKALRGPNLRAYVSIENKLCLLGFFFFLPNLPFSSFPAFPLGENEDLSSCVS